MISVFESAGEVPVDAVSIRWLLQAGFVLKTSVGTTIAIDLYLSDEIERLYGKSRQFPLDITYDEIRPDLVLASHVHEDHFDLPFLLSVLRDGSVRFAGPPSCAEHLLEHGVAPEQVHPLSAGEMCEFRDARVLATAARHLVPGYETPDAIGFVVEAEGMAIYHSGDTEYDAEVATSVTPLEVDVAMICINGTDGNMNVHDAARLGNELGASILVPMHFGLWHRQDYGQHATLDPDLFRHDYVELGGRGLIVEPAFDKSIGLQNEKGAGGMS